MRHHIMARLAHRHSRASCAALARASHAAALSRKHAPRAAHGKAHALRAMPALTRRDHARSDESSIGVNIMTARKGGCIMHDKSAGTRVARKQHL